MSSQQKKQSLFHRLVKSLKWVFLRITKTVTDSVLTNSQNRPNTEYIRFLRNNRIPYTKFIRFLKMIEYQIPNSTIRMLLFK